MIKPIQKYAFTEAEQSAIREIIKYTQKKNVETARIIKNGKNITDKFTIDEYPYRCCAKAKGFCSLLRHYKTNKFFKDATYIHNHPAELPLSIGDVLTVFYKKMQKIIAITPSQKYNIFIPNLEIEPPIEELLAANAKLSEYLKKRGGANCILENKTVLEEYKKNIINFWQQLAEKTNSKYFSNI